MKVKVFHVLPDCPRFEAHGDMQLRGIGLLLLFYRGVAILDVESLDEAFAASNHIDSDWTKADGVQMLYDGRHRSTSVGDMFELPDGSLWVVQPCGLRRHEEVFVQPTLSERAA